MHLSHFLYFFIHNAYRDVDKRSHNLFEDAIKVFVFTPLSLTVMTMVLLVIISPGHVAVAVEGVGDEVERGE